MIDKFFIQKTRQFLFCLWFIMDRRLTFLYSNLFLKTLYYVTGISNLAEWNQFNICLSISLVTQLFLRGFQGHIDGKLATVCLLTKFYTHKLFLFLFVNLKCLNSDVIMLITKRIGYGFITNKCCKAKYCMET